MQQAADPVPGFGKARVRPARDGAGPRGDQQLRGGNRLPGLLQGQALWACSGGS